jgi:replicative DNA helicase
MPADLEAEKSLLGAMLLDPRIVPAVVAEVPPLEWYSPVHQALLDVYDGLVGRLALVELRTLEGAIGASPELAAKLGAHGGGAYLGDLLQAAVTPDNWRFYAGKVKRAASARRLLEAAEQAVMLGYEGADPEEMAETLEQALAVSAKGVKRNTLHARKLVEIAMRQITDRFERGGQTLTGIPTGFRDLDELTGGWQAGDQWVIGGRPSMGKTALEMAFLLAAAVAGFPVLVVSIEMTGASLMSRLLAIRGKIRGTALRTGRLDADEWINLGTASRQIAQMPLWIEDVADDWRAIRSVCHEWARSPEVKKTGRTPLIALDYLQLAQDDGEGRRDDRRERHIGELSTGMKRDVAKRLGCVTHILSQLSRKVEERPNHRPMMSDLRDSGQIEQDADGVLFPYRACVYDKSAGPAAELIIGKQRNGPLGVVDCTFDAATASYLDEITEPPAPEEQEKPATKGGKGKPRNGKPSQIDFKSKLAGDGN